MRRRNATSESGSPVAAEVHGRHRRAPDPGANRVLRLSTANGDEGSAEAPADAEALGQALNNLERLEASYVRALERAGRQRERDDIAAAFDEADQLQGQLIRASHRFRRLRERVSQRATPPDEAA